MLRNLTRRLPTTLSLGVSFLLASCSTSAQPTATRAVQAQPIHHATAYLTQGDTSDADTTATYQPAIYHPDDGGMDVILAATAGPNIRASSWLLLDAHTGKHLASRNAETPRAVASTQKLVTALVVLDAGNLDKPVRVQSSDCHVEPTCLGIKAGEVYTRRQLLYAFLVKSCNDVANVLARDNAGSIPAFAAKMNAKARSLGCTSSNFKNPHGLTVSGQYSTARDMARIAMAAYRSPTIRDAVKRRYYTFQRNNGQTVNLKSTNDLLTRMPECNGMKTGYTVASGRCLISTATRGGRDVILVQLGTRTKYIWDDGKLLMTWGLQKAGRGGSVAMR
ncbi:MAG TPA: D-alanyl-D-alanine carboxypeptidase family protein [Prosthecobacter sp.]|nr:D-alanyl-D-alanine carboxypeptidase family protein [Prosthecobacter sp.]